jgi:hypothetical protein
MQEQEIAFYLLLYPAPAPAPALCSCILLLLLVLELDDAAAHADSDCLGSVRSAELLHDVFDVDLYGLFRDEQFFSNVSITVSVGYFSEHLNFALRERLVAQMLREL